MHPTGGSTMAGLLENTVNLHMDEFRQQILQLNDVLMTNPKAEAIRLFALLSDEETSHLDILGCLFEFLKYPSRKPTTPIQTEQNDQTPTKEAHENSVWTVCSPLEPFGTELGLHALRNWFLLVNTLVVISQGSHAKLKFKYLILPPLVAVVFNMMQWFPEFLCRLRDYIDGWAKRLSYDSKSIEILMDAYRGEGNAVERASEHANIQTASDFIALRGETLKGPVSDGFSSKSGAVNDEEDSAPEEGPSILPAHLLVLMQEWKAASDNGRGISGAEDPDVIDWYKTVLGKRLLGNLEYLRREVDTKYSPMLSKFRGVDQAELTRSKGQILVLLKREIQTRTQLLESEVALIALLDSRHAVLASKFEIFARILLLLDSKGPSGIQFNNSSEDSSNNDCKGGGESSSTTHNKQTTLTHHNHS